MKKIFIVLTFTLLLTSCFGGEEVSVETPQVQEVVQDQVNVEDQTWDLENNEEKLDENSEETDDISVREPVSIEEVEITETGTDNEDYDIRSNIENDPEASVIEEETFVVPTEPRAEEISEEEVEISSEDAKVWDEVVDELAEIVDELFDVIEENE